jgi:hypothetical protein
LVSHGKDRAERRVRQRLGAKKTGGVTHWFSRAANRISEITGNHWTFLVAVVLILV